MRRFAVVSVVVWIAGVTGLGCGKTTSEPGPSADEKQGVVIEPKAIRGEVPAGMRDRAESAGKQSGRGERSATEEGRAARKRKDAKEPKADRAQRDEELSNRRANRKAVKSSQRQAQLDAAERDSRMARENLPPLPEGPYTNVLLITIDTLRVDRMSCYGASRETTPTIDAVAKEGMLFEHAYAQRNSTWPSLATIMTSQYPVQHGVRHNGLMMKNDSLTLAEILAQHGYLCAASYANATSQNWEGFHFRYPIDHEPVDERATHAAVKWLNEHKGHKFFMWLHYLAPHQDYTPPQEFRKYVDAAYDGPIDGSKESITNATVKRFEVTDRDLQQVFNLYDGELLYVDNEVKKVLDVLRDQGVYDHTLIIISSDHGEELYDHHGYFGHGASLYDGVLRVPLILRLPGTIPAGKRDATVVQHLTIAPTVLDVLGIPIPEAFAGKSLAPLFRGEKADFGPAISEMKDQILTIRTADYKYIYNPTNYKPRKLNEERRQRAGIGAARVGKGGGTDVEADVDVDESTVDPELLVMQMKEQELYYVAEDPLEKKEISEGKPDVVESLKKELAAFQSEYRWAFGHEVDKRIQTEIDPELKEKLEAMGYVMNE
ncbi:MAG: hypothetical protein AMXMBFR4_20910 [Candidatus Hydrogenedentota bacterium]